MNASSYLADAIRLLVEEQVEAALDRRGLDPIAERRAQAKHAERIAFATITRVAAAYGISATEILASNRRQPGAEARQLVMVILRRDHGFTEIAAVAAVGRKDRTLYGHAERRITALRETDPEFRARWERLGNGAAHPPPGQPLIAVPAQR